MGDLIQWAITLLVAAPFGIGSIAGTAIEGARLLFWVAIVLLEISVIAGVVLRGQI